jgi:hypothetical protein
MEYYYTTGHGKTAHVHGQTVVLFQELADLPAFELSPKSFWRKLTELFGVAAITFEANPSFSAAYTVRGPDEDGTRALFTPEVLNYFAANRDWTIESKEGKLAIYRQDKPCPAEACPECVATALSIAQMFQRGANSAGEAREPEASEPS